MRVNLYFVDQKGYKMLYKMDLKMKKGLRIATRFNRQPLPWKILVVPVS
jgi:hypothetical protein